MEKARKLRKLPAVAKAAEPCAFSLGSVIMIDE